MQLNVPNGWAPYFDEVLADPEIGVATRDALTQKWMKEKYNQWKSGKLQAVYKQDIATLESNLVTGKATRDAQLQQDVNSSIIP